MTERVCFVIMGYGVKTDLATGRKLNLDKTYKNIIKPTVQEAGLVCIRADEIRYSGVIDPPMYNFLYTADIVIADLSTVNPNAIYELGVRHALRPYTTIAISESKMQYPFDLSHTVIRSYEHLGTDIGYDEVIRFRQELRECIDQILNTPQIDSPVYTYLPGLTPPTLPTSQSILSGIDPKESLSSYVELAMEKMRWKDFSGAIKFLASAKEIDMNNTFITQQLVLATYKSEYPDQVTSLREALRILDDLQPDVTTDPETLGLAGAVHKRLFEALGTMTDLERSIFYCEKGFYIRNDYYNAINLAYLLDLRGSLASGEESIADHILANRFRRRVIEICRGLIAEKDFDTRTDCYWVYATLEEAYFGIRDDVMYERARDKALEIPGTAKWQRESTVEQIDKLAKLIRTQ